ncbi:flagellar biosynthesis protein FlhB [Brevibacillus sp. SYSU BS000544]|uniref:flagellar biosynthesis protein FlhB n=1 Tax=Brevibacillus sp. SYSU BS000544 TaxID=3416443 RepID=UPI003CE502D5
MKQLHMMFPVDLQFFNGEKTEKATPRKKEDARKKGQVAKSSDLSPAIALTAMFGLFLVSGPWMLETFLYIMQESLSRYTLMEVNAENLGFITNQLIFEAMKIVGPALGVALIMALAANYLQVGVLFTTEPLMMKLEKLNPIEGAKKIFSLRSLVELVKSVLKISVGLYVAYSILWKSKEELMRLSLESLDAVLAFTSAQVIKLGLFIGITFIVLALLDYLYQKYEYEKSLKMSKQDIKDEYKKTEGDPLIKGKIKEKQRQMAMRRMMQELPKADVVITNPTHFAVAIKYEAGTMTAPTVIAKGQDYMALKIKQIAKQHRIVVMENKPLARALFSQVEIGETIPEDLFKAVAEVLAYVYKLQGKVK